MENLIPGILEQLGIPSVISMLLYLIVHREALHRKQERDAQMEQFKQEIKEIKERSTDLEKGIFTKIDKIYDRLNPINDSVNLIKGYIEGKNDKGK